MSNDLTIKQRKWIEVYIDTGNATDAAMQVYDCKGNRETAAQIGWENMRKLDYSDFMEAAGITDALLQKKLMEGLNSDKVKTSLTEPDQVVPDYPTRHKYLETALKLKKRLGADNNIFQVTNMSMEVKQDGEETQQVAVPSVSGPAPVQDNMRGTEVGEVSPVPDNSSGLGA